MRATIIDFPGPRSAPRKSRTRRRGKIAGFIFPAVDLRRDGLLPKHYFLPRGMGPRQHQRVWWRLLNSPEGSAYCQLMDRVFDAKRELAAALTEQHRMLFATMEQHYPEMARRVMRKMKRRDLMKGEKPS
jgi:hypothetical protein